MLSFALKLQRGDSLLLGRYFSLLHGFMAPASGLTGGKKNSSF